MRWEGKIELCGMLENKLTLLIYIRSHDLRIASDCERDSLMQKPVPHAAVQTIKKIAKSVQRT